MDGGPCVTMFEIAERGRVTKRIDMGWDAQIYWDTIEACEPLQEMIGHNSLIEGSFPEESAWPQSDATVYELMTPAAFALWLDMALRLGRRQTHAELSAMILANAKSRGAKF